MGHAESRPAEWLIFHARGRPTYPQAIESDLSVASAQPITE
jgi:hypothetical protein